MEIKITSRHQPLDDAVRQYLEEKLQRMTRLFDRITAIDAILDAEHGEHIVELVAVAPPNHHRFSAKAEGHDLRQTIDAADQKLEAQVRAWKDRLVDHRP